MPMPGQPIDIRKVARAITAVENQRPEGDELVRDAYRQKRFVPVLGVAGPPGAGKSSLVDHLAIHWAQTGERVGVVAIDPSSPHSGGAMLGDRYRMNRASAHPLVFVRSLSSRGQMGGLNIAAQDVVVALGALGFDRVVLETVGSGQADIDVATLADCVVVVSVPGLGDQIQAAKAGILEIADVYTVNKRDLPGADLVAGHLEANLDLIYAGKAGANENGRMTRGHPAAATSPSVHARHGSAGGTESFWRPPVVPVSARDGAGVDSLADAIDRFLAWQRDSGREARRRGERVRAHVARLAVAHLLALTSEQVSTVELSRIAECVQRGALVPDRAAEAFLDFLFEHRRDRSSLE